MIKNKFNLLKTLTICVSLLLLNCSKENEIAENNSEFTEVAKLFIENSKETLINTEKVEANFQNFMDDINNRQNKSSKNGDDLTFGELSEMLELNFDIPKENSMNFFQIAFDSRELLAQENGRELLMEELQFQASQIDSGNNTNKKPLFAALFEIFGDDAHCSLGVLAHIADAMVLTAGAAITAPTGVGAVICGAGVASSVALATHAASNCN